MTALSRLERERREKRLREEKREERGNERVKRGAERI
jgi:hypothetical protein